MAETFFLLSVSWDSVCPKINFSPFPQGTFHSSSTYSYNLPTVLGDRMEREGRVPDWLLRISHEALSYLYIVPWFLHAALERQHHSWCSPSCMWSHPKLKFVFPASYLGKSWVTNLQCLDLLFFFFLFTLKCYLLLKSIPQLLYYGFHLINREIHNSASTYFDSFQNIKRISEQHLFSDMLQHIWLSFFIASTQLFYCPINQDSFYFHFNIVKDKCLNLVSYIGNLYLA